MCICYINNGSYNNLVGTHVTSYGVTSEQGRLKVQASVGGASSGGAKSAVGLVKVRQITLLRRCKPRESKKSSLMTS